MATTTQTPDDDDPFEEDLERAANGEPGGWQRLWANHYEKLHRFATDWLANQRRHGKHKDVSLGGTDIAALAYERMHDRIAATAKGRDYFFASLRYECLRIVVDHFRKTKKHKGRGPLKRIDFEPHALEGQAAHVDPDVIFDLVDSLGKYGSRVRDIAMLKVFTSRPVEGTPGATRELTNLEVAEELGISQRTVEAEWPFARAIVNKELGKS
ncbi:MAG: hypothetical protein JNL08_13065 [Planctomycetes bacterium]|nr:hypothetical protein [Planctomycetota bacterium]